MSRKAAKIPLQEIPEANELLTRHLNICKQIQRLRENTNLPYVPLPWQKYGMSYEKLSNGNVVIHPSRMALANSTCSSMLLFYWSSPRNPEDHYQDNAKNILLRQMFQTIHMCINRGSKAAYERMHKLAKEMEDAAAKPTGSAGAINNQKFARLHTGYIYDCLCGLDVTISQLLQLLFFCACFDSENLSNTSDYLEENDAPIKAACYLLSWYLHILNLNFTVIVPAEDREKRETDLHEKCKRFIYYAQQTFAPLLKDTWPNPSSSSSSSSSTDAPVLQRIIKRVADENSPAGMETDNIGIRIANVQLLFNDIFETDVLKRFENLLTQLQASKLVYSKFHLNREGFIPSSSELQKRSFSDTLDNDDGPISKGKSKGQVIIPPLRVRLSNEILAPFSKWIYGTQAQDLSFPVNQSTSSTPVEFNGEEFIIGSPLSEQNVSELSANFSLSSSSSSLLSSSSLTPSSTSQSSSYPTSPSFSPQSSPFSIATQAISSQSSVSPATHNNMPHIYMFGEFSPDDVSDYLVTASTPSGSNKQQRLETSIAVHENNNLEEVMNTWNLDSGIHDPGTPAYQEPNDNSMSSTPGFRFG